MRVRLRHLGCSQLSTLPNMAMYVSSMHPKTVLMADGPSLKSGKRCNLASPSGVLKAILRRDFIHCGNHSSLPMSADTPP